jgi:hypothetical protein
MNEAVQVGLVFPRSGQQVLVHIPRAYAERIGIDPLDPKRPQGASEPSTGSHLHREPIQHAR